EELESLARRALLDKGHLPAGLQQLFTDEISRRRLPSAAPAAPAAPPAQPVRTSMDFDDLAPRATDLKGVARIMNVSTDFAEKLKQRGGIPGGFRLKGSNRWRYPIRLIQRWVDAGCPDPATWPGTEGG
ncbi:MAG: hypothetical protein FD125_3046, partial [bacterium]